jgi:hypothetical protein
MVSRSCHGSKSIDAWIWRSSTTNVTKDSRPRQRLPSSLWLTVQTDEGKQCVIQNQEARSAMAEDRMSA